MRNEMLQNKNIKTKICYAHKNAGDLEWFMSHISKKS